MQKLSDIDWNSWQATDQATLCFVFRDDQVLLIRKKRGLGAGKINGPGGRIHAGESVEAAAIREVEEELRVTPQDLRQGGQLSFQFTDGYSIFVTVFRSETFRGTPEETDEAVPLWTVLDDIPYAEMWADDVLWLPHLIAGTPFKGRFIFEGDSMLDYDLQLGQDVIT